MAGIRIEVDDSELLRRLREMGDLMQNPTPLMDAIGSGLSSLLDLQFRNSMSPYGIPWAPLTSRSGQPLRNTGVHMASTINHFAASDFVDVGIGFRWAYVHQHGATIRPVRAKKLHFTIDGQDVFADKVEIPARPILPLNGVPIEWADTIKETTTSYLDSVMA